MSLCLFSKTSNLYEFSRKLISANAVVRKLTYSQPLYFNTTPISWAEPAKRKKRVDPSILKGRDDRKKRRLAREIKRLSRNVLQPKPLVEMEISMDLKSTAIDRVRSQLKLSHEETEDRVNTMYNWGLFKRYQFEDDISMIKKVLLAKEEALKALRTESEELYQEAIRLDDILMPFKCKGPSIYPPMKTFDPLNGEIVDITRNWDKF